MRMAALEVKKCKIKLNNYLNLSLPVGYLGRSEVFYYVPFKHIVMMFYKLEKVILLPVKMQR